MKGLIPEWNQHRILLCQQSDTPVRVSKMVTLLGKILKEQKQNQKKMQLVILGGENQLIQGFTIWENFCKNCNLSPNIDPNVIFNSKGNNKLDRYFSEQLSPYLHHYPQQISQKIKAIFWGQVLAHFPFSASQYVVLTELGKHIPEGDRAILDQLHQLVIEEHRSKFIIHSPADYAFWEIHSKGSILFNSEGQYQGIETSPPRLELSLPSHFNNSTKLSA